MGAGLSANATDAEGGASRQNEHCYHHYEHDYASFRHFEPPRQLKNQRISTKKKMTFLGLSTHAAYAERSASCQNEHCHHHHEHDYASFRHFEPPRRLKN
mgnify:CR=1 FL=1